MPRDNQSFEPWDAPTPLPTLLPKAPSLPESMVPEPLRPWIVDASERMQAPLDFFAAPAIVALGSLLGRRVGIHPKVRDDWLEIPNLWGAIVGRSGVMKSPALHEALKPANKIAAQAAEEHDEARAAATADKMAVEEEIKATRKLIRGASGEGKSEEATKHKAKLKELACELEAADKKPRRYTTSDPTVEKLGELLKDNPNGLLLFRDELMGFLRGLEKQGHESDRQFYLESWSGKNRHEVDRIGRGSIHIEGLCMSILGGIQPGPLSSYLSAAMRYAVDDDGMLQRFQMLVWPETSADYKNIDRDPNMDAKERAFWIFKQCSELKGEAMGAERRFDNPPALRFAPNAQPLFNNWLVEIERRIRAGFDAPSFESHMSKYRGLMPSLALIFHIVSVVSGGEPGPISFEAARSAAEWCEYLERHARKVYAPELNRDLTAAHALVSKIDSGDIKDGEPIREVYRPHWGGIGSIEVVQAGLKILERHGRVRLEAHSSGGRPSKVIRINPAA
jgi:putative DNA primase/helicase